MAGRVIGGTGDRPPAHGEDHEDLPVEDRDLAEARAGDTDHAVLAARVQLQPLDAGVVTGERIADPLQHRLAAVADKVGEDPLVPDVRIESGLDRVEIAPAPGMAMVEDDFPRSVTR